MTDPHDPGLVVDEPGPGDGRADAESVAQRPTAKPGDATLGMLNGGGRDGGNGTGGGTGDGGAGEGTPSDGTAETQTTNSSRWLREAIIVVVIAVLVAVLLRAFVVQTFYIPSGSMLPTLQIGDRILVDKLAYDLHDVDRGNIVVFSRPPAEDCGGPEVNDLVKRVIGLPGDVISLSGGHVYIDGKRLDESWLPAQEQGVTTSGPPGTAYSLTHPYKVPANDYFVMGDNRTDSCDSRYWGPIPKSLIVGKVDLRVWPITSLKFF